MDRDIKYLFELLDDDNEQTASLAMAELIDRDNKTLDTMLRKLQETPNPRLRRRVHQLQSAVTSRRVRKNFASALEDGSVDLLDGIIQLHLLWFDNDLQETVLHQWKELLEDSRKYDLSTLARLAFYLMKKGLTCSPRDELEAEYFCIGTVLDEMIGSDLLLAVIASLIGHHNGLELNVVRIHSDYAVANSRGDILLPGNDWKIARRTNNEPPLEHCSASTILRSLGALLFVCAAASDSFRYVYTLGTCLSKSSGIPNLSKLPYPYHTP